jgi:hypothetical protein
MDQGSRDTPVLCKRCDEAHTETKPIEVICRSCSETGKKQ